MEFAIATYNAEIDRIVNHTEDASTEALTQALETLETTLLETMSPEQVNVVLDELFENA